MEFRAANVSAALDLCRQLVSDGRADLFRGQARDWPKLAPSLMRVTGKKRRSAQKELDLFRDWARSVPQMAAYGGADAPIIAIAQHYGVLTALLDLTVNPEIAALFAKPSGNDAKLSDAVIYCFLESELRSLKSAELIRLDVENLWRLEAQGGLFLHFLNDDLVEVIREKSIRIYFPASQLTVEERDRLYPPRKSALEAIIDQWLYRRQIEELTDKLRSSSKKSRILGTRRESYPGAFRWRIMPELEPQWMNMESAWIVQSVESVALMENSTVVMIPDFDFSDPEIAHKKVAAAIGAEIRQERETKQLITFAVNLSALKKSLSANVSTLLNRCWDGLRVLPFPSEELINSISLISILLIARAEGVTNVDDWQKELFGELMYIEVAPIGGHIEAGSVSKADFIGALSNEHKERLTDFMQMLLVKDPDRLMMYIVDHWILFKFENFRNIFIEQFIPSAVDSYWKEDLNLYQGGLECMWSLNFNPALLGYVTQFEYRLKSPVAHETNCDKIVYIFPEMEKADIEEAFISCLPSILESGEPFQVKFDGYSLDPRELWEIERAVEQSKWIVEVGGISCLEVFSTIKLDPTKIKKKKVEIINSGFGAFEVWAMSKGLMNEVRGKPLVSIKSIIDEFWINLMIANENLDNRAKSAPDWPGTK